MITNTKRSNTDCGREWKHDPGQIVWGEQASSSDEPDQQVSCCWWSGHGFVDDSGNYDSGNNTTAGTSMATVMVVMVLTAILVIETTWLRTHPTHCYDHGHDGHGHVDHGDDDTTAGWRWSSTPTTRSPAPASRSTGPQFEKFNQSIITKDNLLWYNMISKLLLNLYLYYLIDCSL